MSQEKYDIVIVGAGPMGLQGEAHRQPTGAHQNRSRGWNPSRVQLNFAQPRPEAQDNGIRTCKALLHQGKIERVFLEEIEKTGTVVERPSTVVGFKNDGKDPEYPVEVNLKDLDTNVHTTVRAKYLFGGEGARSFIREQQNIGIRHKDPIAHVWGVMDGVVRTNFPDIKTKCTIHSDHGSIMVIPREDDMVRLYVQLASSTDKDWNPRMTATVDQVKEAAAKIHLVEGGMAKRDILTTYESERKMIAETLLDFDAKYAKLFSTRIPSVSEVDSALGRSKSDETNEFVKAFKSACEFTSGYGVVYTPNIFTWSPSHPAQSPLFNPKGVKLVPGRALPTCTVTRVLDANRVALEQEVPANGSFRVFVLAGDINKNKTALADFNSNLLKSRSFYSTYSRPADQAVSYFERHNPHSRFFSLLLVFANLRDEVEISSLPSTFQAYSHHIYTDDLSDRFVPDAKAPAHEKMGLEKGGVVVVRPDGHIACSVELVEGSGTVDALNQFFGSFSEKPLGGEAGQSRL
ncbi:phenol 2-monooxygenase [Coccidioides immitis H538.4]|uniref:Phenol 2-monooxygenase n=1 Tax=Coccidioides immitis H538.4 TaxID=396776 RepID=A0A0J8UB16_COCIT|nr:phenol 2-monooxygenase [Coccidioides immitis H538.4]